MRVNICVLNIVSDVNIMSLGTEVRMHRRVRIDNPEIGLVTYKQVFVINEGYSKNQWEKEESFNNNIV